MEASEQFKQVELSLIEISGANPRKDIKGESFKEIKQSIAELGILEPLIVRPKGKGYELVAGERRLTAAKELKLETVPVMIRNLDDHTARVVMLLENLQREDLQPLEEAAAIEELLKDTGDGGMTQEELAKKLSKSQPWVANRLRLLKAPKPLKELVEKGVITPQHVMELLPFVEHKVFQEVLLPEIKDDLKRNGSVTVDRLKWHIRQALCANDTEHVLDLTNFTYETRPWQPFFDFSGCDKCVHVVQVESDHSSKDKDRICLNRSCYADRLNIAKRKHEESIKQEREEVRQELEKKLGKKIKSVSVDTSKLQYDKYTTFYSKEFDITDCKGCEFYKLEKGRNATLDGEKDPRRVCLKPSCYRGKKSQKTRETNKICRAAIETSELSLEEYLKSRSKGFTTGELQYICGRIARLVPGSYGRYDDVNEAKKAAKTEPSELESTIMRLLVKEELGPIRSMLSMESLKKAQGSWPFKVTKEKTPEPPKAKKVQEKRKKKGKGP